MAYKTYSQQLEEHIRILQENGLVVDQLIVRENGDDAFDRVCSRDQIGGRPEFSYNSKKSVLQNGLTGITTRYRGIKGKMDFHSSYGHGPTGTEHVSLVQVEQKLFTSVADHKAAAHKACGFWQHSFTSGSSPYLERKSVGAYGLRFRKNEEYGRTAVVPMRDEHGKIWSYQLLQESGRKVFAKDGRTDGLFHVLKEPKGSKFVGIAEGYSTAATCLELTSFPIVCAFSASNLKHVTVILRMLYPDYVLVVFADNDRHNDDDKNIGLIEADKAKKAVEGKAIVVFPDFLDIAPAKDATDFNDLVRLKGADTAKDQVRTQIRAQLKNIEALK